MLNALRHQRFERFSQTSARVWFEDVLNALRHQRFERIVSNYQPEIRLTRAQRLAASEVRAVLIALVESVLFKCSTPCGIRGSSGFDCEGVANDAHEVLNALRHQRFERRQLTRYPFGESRVLNALRHQRFERVELGSTFNFAIMCSTPCGIRGSSGMLSTFFSAASTGAQRLAASEVRAGLSS